MSTRWSRDFLDLLTALNDAEARYLLVGGHAVGVHGRPRATKDFDLWIEATPTNADRVFRALEGFGAPLGSMRPADFATPGNGFRMAPLPSASSCSRPCPDSISRTLGSGANRTTSTGSRAS
jgi:hypothetical protein